jgi:SAM-dependent methyltransferase
MKQLNTWNKLAFSYSNFMRVSYTIQNIVHPYILRQIGEAKHILDFGCGNGDLISKITKFDTLTAYDPNRTFINMAKKQVKQTKVHFTCNKKDLAKHNYDFIILNFVLMSISSNSAIVKLLKYLNSLLMPSGRVLIGVTHPCFRHCSFSFFDTSFNSDSFLYRHEGHPFKVRLFSNSTALPIYLENYHYSLSSLLNNVYLSGLQLRTVDELYDKKTKHSKYSQFPPYLMLVLEQST